MIITEQVKYCPKCKLMLRGHDFYKDRKAFSGLRGWCKKCCAASNRAYKDAKPGRTKDIWLKSTYGISLAELTEMFSKQDGLCLLCGEPGKLFIDHNHATGKVRGLIHNRCNIRLGGIEDEKFLAMAQAYLSKESGEINGTL